MDEIKRKERIKGMMEGFAYGLLVGVIAEVIILYVICQYTE